MQTIFFIKKRKTYKRIVLLDQDLYIHRKSVLKSRPVSTSALIKPVVTEPVGKIKKA